MKHHLLQKSCSGVEYFEDDILLIYSLNFTANNSLGRSRISFGIYEYFDPLPAVLLSSANTIE
jgi:hypothetical protein